MKQFKVLRFGFINYFGYKSQEIKLDDGIGVIQGSNGTGKTITVSSLLPSLLTLDLKKSMNMNKPTRAGRDPDNFVGTTESPSYIWMEVGNDKYKKTIAGTYKAKNPSGIEQKAIIFKDNVNVDERTFSSTTGEVYNFKQFKDFNEGLIEGIYEYGQRDVYAKRINELFYGFKDMEDYNRNIDIIYNLENATQGNETIDLKYIQENLKSILPDYEEETNNQIRGFIETVKNNKEAKEKKEAYERNAELLDKISTLVGNYNYKYIENIRKSSNYLDQKLNTLKEKIERTKEKKEIQEKELNQLRAREREIALRLNGIEKEKSIINIDDIKDIKLHLNEVKQKIDIFNKSLKNYERQLKKIEKNILNKNERIDKYKNDIYDCNVLLNDESVIVELLNNKTNLLKEVERQTTYIKELDKIEKENSRDKFKLEMLENALSKSKTKLAETDESIIKETESLQNKLMEWLESLSINTPKDFSIDYFIENNRFKEQINIQRDSRKDDKNRLERELEELYNNKKELEDKQKELENNIKPKSYSKYEKGHELYECIDFKSNIDDTLKLKIEGALRESNLLFVVFYPEQMECGYKYVNKMSLGTPSKRLSSLFNISQAIPSYIRENVFEFLNNIYINEIGNVVYENIEIIPKEIRDNIEYIGEKERKKKRAQDIFKIHEEIGVTEANIVNKKASLERVNNTLKNFDNVVNKEPSFNKLNNLKNNYNNIVDNINKEEDELKEVNKRLKTYNNKVKEINDKMYEYLPKDNNITTFENKIKEIINIQREVSLKQDLLEETEGDLENYIEEKKSTKENLEMDEVELEKALNSKEQYESKINSKETKDRLNELNELEDEEESLKKELQDKLKKEGTLERDIEHIQEELNKDTNGYKALSKEKDAKDLLMENYKIKNFSKPSKIVSINKFDSDLNKYTIEFDNQPYNNYTTEVNRDGGFKFNTESCSRELADIQNAYQQLKEINFKTNNETYTMEEVEKEFIEELEKCRKLVDDNTNRQLQLFSGTTIVGPINKIVEKAFDIAEEIQEEMNNKEQNDYMSFFIEYKITDSATAFQKTFFKKNSNKLKKDYKEKLSFFIESLASKIENAVDEGMGKDEIEELVFDELNYKKIIDVKIYYKLNKNAERKPLNKKAMASISEGQRRRAMLEPMFIVLKKNLDKADLKENALSILLLDEGFNKMDYEQQQLLEETIYKSFGTILIASSTTTLFGPKNGSKIVNYIFLNKIVSKDGSEIIYVDKPKSVVVSYE